MLKSEIESLLDAGRQPGAAGHRALGRLIRLVDDSPAAADDIDEAVKSSSFRAARIGLTGPPGGGKSTLIAVALDVLVERGKRVGVLAVDPTSPFTGGALLGDRVRLRGPTGESVFFRSLASRGALGGVSNAVWPASRLLDWWGADIVLIETVGAGQLGIAVKDVADLVVAVLTPETGDGIQSMKAGVMELADCFIVNKSDRPGSELMLRELRLVQEEARAVGRSVEVYETSALDGRGVREAIDGLAALWAGLESSGGIATRRIEQVKSEIAFRTERRLHARMASTLGGAEAYDTALLEWAERILAGEATASTAAAELAR